MVHSQMRYLARDKLYQSEKPYSADFETDELNGQRKSNFILELCNVDVSPMTSLSGFDMDVNGFCVLEEDTSLTFEDAATRPEQAESEYQRQLEQILHKHFPVYTRLEPLDFVIRQRHPRFPSESTDIITYEQPAAVAHVDYSLDGAIQQLKGSFPGQEAHFLNKDFDMINVWKPLIGPNDDWPLALCDYASIQSSDVAKADVLHTDRTTENKLLQFSDGHRWHYVEHQRTTDLIVFRNADSTDSRAIGFHAAIRNPQSEGAPRTSIEVRFVAFR
ncbi:hypothetical protein KC343_g1093 [Hortaea werneckii]|nr:hypothetical protein KC352_g4095 [Hortaea werneckii]KAI7572863.1 hypothetical protein KC317_g384 [Hortaea werneckii]KAI7628197.1 hypothetical protein KC346_g336 [Hortaea werneckii]KAI7636755.1 hypothetical protein KC343_g1093 [Hortaea werneckii]KAI7683427.1 hypothetical protein KC319_g465 [Hortaea werneckii]